MSQGTDNAMILQAMIEQCKSDSDRWFPGKAQSLPNLVLCMCGEAGEVANIVKKVVRGSMTLEQAMSPFHEEGKDTLQEEIVDVLIYLCNLMGAKEFEDVDWKAIWDSKRDFNESRFGNECGQSNCQHAPDGGNHPIVGSGITLSQTDQMGR